MKHKGQTYTGKHRPMVTWNEFDQVQRMLARHQPDQPRPKRHSFTFGHGLLTCGACGAKISAQFTTNRFGTRYIYYRCCRNSKKYSFCPQPSIEERELAKQFAEHIAALTLPAAVLADIERALPRVLAEHSQNSTDTTNRLQALVAEKERFLERARKLYIEDKVTEDEFARDRERLLGELRTLRSEIEKAQDPTRLFKPFVDGIAVLRTAVSVMRDGESAQKRELIQKLYSNPTLKGKTLVVLAKEPYASLVKNRAIPIL
jgi:hypothetical protein